MKTFFKNFKTADFAIIAGIIVLCIIFVLAFLGKNKFLSKSPVLEEKNIAFTVFFRGVTITDSISPFRTSENAFITIRNVPYKKLEIIDVKFDRRKTLVEAEKKGEYKIVDDISVPFVFDFVVTLKDKAKITDDGAVVGGNKIKMGIPIILEGKNYKYTGVVSNIQIIEENSNSPENTDKSKETKNETNQENK